MPTPGEAPRSLRERRAREARRARVADMLVTGRSYSYMAETEGVSVPTIERDVRAISEEWRRRQAEGYEAKVARAVAKIEKAEAEAWDAWEKSKEGTTKSVTRRITGGLSGDRSTAEVVRMKGVGDPAFLAVLSRLWDQRAKHEGTYAPTRTDIDVKLGVEDVFKSDTIELSRRRQAERMQRADLQPRSLPSPTDVSTNGTGNGVDRSEAVVGGDDDDDDEGNNSSSSNGTGNGRA